MGTGNRVPLEKRGARRSTLQKPRSFKTTGTCDVSFPPEGADRVTVKCRGPPTDQVENHVWGHLFPCIPSPPLYSSSWALMSPPGAASLGNGPLEKKTWPLAANPATLYARNSLSLSLSLSLSQTWISEVANRLNGWEGA